MSNPRVSLRKAKPRRANQVRTVVQIDSRDQARRTTEDLLSQRLFSIALAAYAAEGSIAQDPARLQRILELIRAQSAASLEDLRRLSGLR